MLEPSLALCSEGRSEVLAGATHWLQHEEPERVAQALLGFFGAG
jgi:hypothetical protein